MLSGCAHKRERRSGLLSDSAHIGGKERHLWDRDEVVSKFYIYLLVTLHFIMSIVVHMTCLERGNKLFLKYNKLFFLTCICLFISFPLTSNPHFVQLHKSTN